MDLVPPFPNIVAQMDIVNRLCHQRAWSGNSESKLTLPFCQLRYIAHVVSHGDLDVSCRAQSGEGQFDHDLRGRPTHYVYILTILHYRYPS
jgi:hypothetical protein